MQPQVKSGLLSTEFYVTIANMAGGLAVTLGYLTPIQADEFQRAIVSVIGGVMVIGSTLLYIYNRISLKKEAIKAMTNPQESFETPTNSAPAVYPK